MNRKELTTDCSESIASVSAALFELRDALLELSLALKDLQFDTDHVRREEAARTFRKLLEKIQ